MKFTKENVEKIIADWFFKDGNSEVSDLVEQIKELDDDISWIVIDYEGSLVYVGDYEEAKIEYEKELDIALRDFDGEYFGEDDMGLKVILAKVDKALNLYMDKDEDDNDVWYTKKYK